MRAVADSAATGTILEPDNRVVLHGVSWADFERLLEIRGDSPAPRFTYLEGELELMSPSRDHEAIKKHIARLVEAYADFHGVELNGVGSWTLKSRAKERGVEPDECYVVGESAEKIGPDLAIEVEWSRPLLDKLQVYAGLGVRELWVWRRNEIVVQILVDGNYRAVARSRVFPDLDLGVLVRFLDQPSQSKSVREFRAWLREPG